MDLKHKRPTIKNIFLIISIFIDPQIFQKWFKNLKNTFIKNLPLLFLMHLYFKICLPWFMVRPKIVSKNVGIKGRHVW